MSMSISSSPSIPRHKRSPGDDGYRTPTIEDAERSLSILGVIDSPASRAREVHSTALEAVLQKVPSRATDRAAISSEEKEKSFRNCLDQHSQLHRTITDSSATTLSWKKRIRHVTWAYFTITMATGGLANVLYEGIFLFLFLFSFFSFSFFFPSEWRWC